MNKVLLLVGAAISTCFLQFNGFISQKSVYYHVPETFGCYSSDCNSISNAAEWHILEENITTTNVKNIYIYWAGFGGNVAYMEVFIDALKKAESQGKTITFIMKGNAYSAHAVSACYATNIMYLDKYFLMFHPVADESGHPLTNPNIVSEFRKVLQPCIDKGILTENDRSLSQTTTEVYVEYKNGKYVRAYRPDKRQ